MFSVDCSLLRAHQRTQAACLSTDFGSNPPASRCPPLLLQNEMSPWQIAAREGRVSCMRVLQRAGAEIHAVTATIGWNALHFASCNDNEAAVSLLLEVGLNIEARTAGADEARRRKTHASNQALDPSREKAREREGGLAALVLWEAYPSSVTPAGARQEAGRQQKSRRSFATAGCGHSLLPLAACSGAVDRSPSRRSGRPPVHPQRTPKGRRVREFSEQGAVGERERMR